jgi:hypothetical protein
MLTVVWGPPPDAGLMVRVTPLVTDELPVNVALIVTVKGLLMPVGAVYKPPMVIFPQPKPEQPIPETFQENEGRPPAELVTANCCFAPAVSAVTGSGVVVTVSVTALAKVAVANTRAINTTGSSFLVGLVMSELRKSPNRDIFGEITEDVPDQGSYLLDEVAWAIAAGGTADETALREEAGISIPTISCIVLESAAPLKK